MTSPEQSTSFFTDADMEVRVVDADKVEGFNPDTYIPEVLPSNGEKLNIIVDKERAYPILDTLLNAYVQNQPPYNLDRVRLPHDPRHMPKTLERGTVDHAMFLFNVCYYMRGGIKSNDAMKRMATVYDDYPQLFNCEFAKDFSETDLQTILKEHGLGFQGTVAKQWVENSRRMLERFEGDPRNIFSDVTDYDQSLELVQNDRRGKGFVGFQEKMTSMIIYYLMDEELIEPFNFPIPIDLHVMRVSIANQLVTFTQSGNPVPYGTNLFSKELPAALRDLYLQYAEERQVNPLRLCDAVWLLSESSCGKHPGNVTIEPLTRKFRNGRKTYLQPKEVDVSDPTQQKAYGESCAVCPVENTCELNIPGSQYYISGNLIVRGTRVRFPLDQLMRTL